MAQAASPPLVGACFCVVFVWFVALGQYNGLAAGRTP